MKKLYLILVIVLCINAFAQQPDQQIRVHRSSNIALSVTNYGKIGSQAGTLIDPESGEMAPSAEFPSGSNIEYLFQGMIWIGAIVDDPENPGVLDTLVSIGDDGWWYGINELNPPPAGYQSIWKDSTLADEEYIAVYQDTTLTGVENDPQDGRPHIPLGVEITQHSRSWSTTGYNEFIVIDYAIKNISNRTINSVWAGFYVDGDVMHISENDYGQEEGAQDDLNGYIQHGDYGVAWTADNDGQPYYGQYEDISPTGILGLFLLHSTIPELETSFNWWVSNVNSTYDWGPVQQANYRVFPGDGVGTPGGDVAKYFVMSNGEIDYDLAYSALDWSDSSGNWIANGFQDPDGNANGHDIRYLLSYGPIPQLNPNEVETLTVAFVARSGFHTDPNNYAFNLSDYTQDPASIDQFYANLDFSDLLHKIDNLAELYQTNFETVPLGPPSNFRVADWTTESVDLVWDGQIRDNFSEFRVYRGTQSGVYDPAPITPSGFTDTTFTDTDVIDNQDYYYVICRVNTYDSQGGYSAEIAINPGQPTMPTGLSAIRGNERVDLTWNANPESDMRGYFIYRAIGYQNNQFELIDSTLETSYTDYPVVNGFRHAYKIKAYDTFGISSYFSDTVSTIPMGFDRGVLLLNANVNNSLFPDYELAKDFYEDLLTSLRTEYDAAQGVPDTILLITPYKVVIWIEEQSMPPNQFVYFENQQHSLIHSYLDGGGKLILIGSRNARITTPYGEGVYDFNTDGLFYDYFNLAGVDHPSIYSDEFIGGIGRVGQTQDFYLDTARVNRLNYPWSEHTGRLNGISALIPRDTSEVIYSYNAVNPDTSDYHGRPVGVLHQTETYATAVLEFPLYFTEPGAAFDIIHHLLYGFGVVGIHDPDIEALPEKTSLLQNYPNPFNAQTRIQFQLNQTSNVEITIYDILGRKVETMGLGERQAGTHLVIWDAGNITSGVYFARLSAGPGADIIKMLLLK